MAQRNLRAAAEAAERYPEIARGLDVDEEETAAWRDAAAAMLIPYDEQLGVHPQAESFTQHEVWDFEGTTSEQYPLLLHFPYFDLYRKQVVKQADLVLALHLCGDSFTAEQKLANFDYYEPLTVRDSSLSACTQAVVAAEVGYLKLAYAYFREAALIDLDDLEHNVRDGVHIASLAGAWTAAVAGFGGMRDEGEVAQLPTAPTRRRSAGWRSGSVIATPRSRSRSSPTHATYSLLSGERAQLGHYGSVVELTQDGPATLPIPKTTRREPPHQPPGRELLTSSETG